MSHDKFHLHKSPVFTFEWVGFKDIITDKIGFSCHYTRYANFGMLKIGPIQIGFRLPWLKYNIWIKGYEVGYREGLSNAHDTLQTLIK